MLGCACAECGVCGAGHVKLMGRESTSTDPRDPSNYGDPPDRRPTVRRGQPMSVNQLHAAGSASLTSKSSISPNRFNDDSHNIDPIYHHRIIVVTYSFI